MSNSIYVCALTTLLALGAMGCKEDPPAAPAKPSASPSVATPPKPSVVPSAAASATPPKDPNACPPGSKPTEYKYADVKFEWTDKPDIEKVPKNGVFASVGGKPFEMPTVEITVNEGTGEWSIRGKGGELGPSLSFKGEPKAGITVNEKFGSGNRGYFQVPKKGDKAECFNQTTSYNGTNARIVRIRKYDGKVADGEFVTTWEESMGDKRKFWAAGTFKDAKVTIFKK